MTDESTRLRGTRILVLEDDYYLATDLRRTIAAAGGTVSGPFPDEASAISSLDRDLPDCAFIDVNLGQGPSFVLARDLARRGVQFAFVTGYDAGVIPEEFEAVSRLEKPVDARKIVIAAVALRGARTP